ncbi:hypothetical protein GTC6_09449 [Gordonia terrae C-6]|uniref:Uncharacterized protein n=1 Tax=Gordonia terrae C-6 TaxID=1316928 RepID=R7YAJ3_9ACTN|nr:hypothetical protein GTC6_09449 [Gordonia terrae C-6]
MRSVSRLAVVCIGVALLGAVAGVIWALVTRRRPESCSKVSAATTSPPTSTAWEPSP